MQGKLSAISRLQQQGIYDPSMFLNVLELREALDGCESVLDVGCGVSSPLQYLGIKNLVGVDGYAPAIEHARKLGTHSEFAVGDIRNLTQLFGTRRFDACVALDVIEHLPKEEGYKLIEGMAAIANRRIIFLTPNGFLPQRHQERDDLQEHLSGWDAEEMQKLGFRVVGMLGPKRIRGEFHRIIRRPRPFWAAYSLVTQLIHTRTHPKGAAAILCIRDK